MSMILYLRPTSDSKIDELLKDPEAIEDFIDEESDHDIELDKAWHGIHYLLTKDPWEGEEPVCYLLAKGEEVGDIDVGYGPARAVSSKKVAEFAAAVSKIDDTEFRKRFDPKAMMNSDIYPTIWDRAPSEDDTLGYLCTYFADLKEFLKKAKAEKNGMIVWMS